MVTFQAYHAIFTCRRPPEGDGRQEKMKLRNIFGNRYNGALGKDMVAVTWKGHQYIREYVTPVNPKTELQMQHRAIFNDAVKAWHGLAPRQREFYDRIADGMSGYNLFVGRYVGSVRNGFAPEIPILMQWVTEDGQPLDQCWLIVRQRTRELFVDNLKDAKGEVALSPSDTPYTFVLRRGTQEDAVLTVENLLEQDIPMVLESKTLGIRLVGNVPPPGEANPSPK